MAITFKIYMPERLVIEKNVHRVVLPNDGKTLTVIPERAPTLATLDMGVIKILDEENQTADEFFISGGIADIKEDTCTVLTESAFNRADLDLEKARALYEEFNNPFYKWLVKQFEK